MFIFFMGAISSWPLGALVRGRLTRACYNLKRRTPPKHRPRGLKQAGDQADCLQVRALKLVSKDGEESARERRGGGRCGVGTDHTGPLPDRVRLVSLFYSPVQGRAARRGQESWGLLACGITAVLCEWMSQLLSLSILLLGGGDVTERVARAQHPACLTSSRWFSL